MGRSRSPASIDHQRTPDSTAVAMIVPADVTRPETRIGVLSLIAGQEMTNTVNRSVTTTRRPIVNRITGQVPVTAFTSPKIG
jgi:hypothetical protein